MFRKKQKKKIFNLLVAGGVAANKTIRDNLSTLSNEMNFETIYPDLKFCGDNAAMIAWAGIQRFKKNIIDDVMYQQNQGWPLDKNAPYMERSWIKIVMQYWLSEIRTLTFGQLNNKRKLGKKGATGMVLEIINAQTI
jgi:hypothetical protein